MGQGRSAIPILGVVCFALLGGAARANDGAAEFAGGGLVPRKETRVALERERLFVSWRDIRVEYVFRNTSAEDVVTEVMFPIPRFFTNGQLDRLPFQDFSVEVDGAPVRFARQVRAWLGERDITAILRAAGADPERVCSEWDGKCDLLEGVSPERRASLEEHGPELGGVGRGGGWDLEIVYHWTQRFPANGTVRISHRYTPVMGGSTASPAIEEIPKEFPDGCFDRRTLERIRRARLKRCPAQDCSNGYGVVKYILTTANTWRGPIGEFELLVDRGSPDGAVSFCWDGPVEKVDANTFRARAKDFVPRRNLTVYFMS